MNIIGKIKGLLFGASDAPAEQAPMQSVPHPDQTQSTNAGDNKTKFSESYVLAAQQRAETVLRAFNESFNIAKKSKNRGEREYRIQITREWLDELKKLTIKFPFLSLQNLQAVEADIVSVEVETRALPHGRVVDVSIKDLSDTVRQEIGGQDRQRLSANDEQALLLCIQSCFRVVNESIEIARKSKNLETKMSRLDVARSSLKEAQRQANQFSLKVEGFDAAEAELNRIDEAIKNGTQTEIARMQHIEINDSFASPARNFLKEATVLKKERKYIEACDKLRKAYLADGSENLMIEDWLRLPMYLQLAGKNDDGWYELNRLLAKHTDQFSQPAIANQMRVFLQKGGKAKKAVLYGVWTLCKVIEANNKNLDSCYRLADSKEISIFDSDPVVGQTPNGNPIHDRSYQFFADRVKKQFSCEEIESHIAPLLKKAKLDQSLDGLSSDLREYLLSNRSYDMKDVQVICEKFTVN